jgi:hypothetical protein
MQDSQKAVLCQVFRHRTDEIYAFLLNKHISNNEIDFPWIMKVIYRAYDRQYYDLVGVLIRYLLIF